MALTVQTKVYLVVGGTSAISMAIGAAASYFITKNVLTTKYDALLAEEIVQAKKYYKRLNKLEEFSSPTEVLKTRAEELGYSSAAIEMHLEADSDDFAEAVEEQEQRVSNIFHEAARVNNEFDLEAEMELRSGDRPYIITHDEFYENVGDWEQVTLTYFEDDDVLCDERDAPVEDSDALVGDANLNRFGAGSKDNNVVYIQNDHLQTQFEIVRNKGNYAKEVLGFIEHSERRGVRKFRSDNE